MHAAWLVAPIPLSFPFVGQLVRLSFSPARTVRPTLSSAVALPVAPKRVVSDTVRWCTRLHVVAPSVFVLAHQRAHLPAAQELSKRTSASHMATVRISAKSAWNVCLDSLSRDRSCRRHSQLQSLHPSPRTMHTLRLAASATCVGVRVAFWLLKALNAGLQSAGHPSKGNLCVMGCLACFLGLALA